ncbi:MAG: DUF6958 family protein [Pseudooceanicola sp.]
MTTKTTVENVNHPGLVTRVDSAKYEAMKSAILAAIAPGDAPMTIKALRQALDPHLSHMHFPGGATAGWWLKCVHLDLEAKGILTRAPKPPVRLSRPPEIPISE